MALDDEVGRCSCLAWGLWGVFSLSLPKKDARTVLAITVKRIVYFEVVSGWREDYNSIVHVILKVVFSYIHGRT